MMPNDRNDPLKQMETTCGSLLYELQVIWDEVGETETERDKTLLELERECLEVYRRKVDYANRSRAQLRQAIADDEAELASICSSLGELPLNSRQSEVKGRSLKEELNLIHSQVNEARQKKMERKQKFIEVLEQIERISAEVYGSTTASKVDETDLSIRKLEELQKQLQSLQIEKSNRLKQVVHHLRCLDLLCSVLGLDFVQTLNEVHPSLSGAEEMYNLSNDTIQSLESVISRLRELKLQRMQRMQDLGTSMLELWNLMDTPIEEQQAFQTVTRNIAASEEELIDHNILSLDLIKYVEAEVSRLEELKSSKMKELVLKKRSMLEELCRKTHLVPKVNGETEYLFEAIESGAVDAAAVLEDIELEIGRVKEEAFSRKELLDKVEKWLSACQEESWLEDYEMDDNRYNAGRGAHLTLKRAEKARVLVNKLPGMVDALAAKARAWEKERQIDFCYDGVRLLSMLEEYKLFRLEKEEEKKRQREQKKLQGQLITEQEALFGSKPSPMKLQSGKKKGPRMSMGGNGNRRLSVGGINFQTQRPDSSHSARSTPHSRPVKKTVKDDIGITTHAKRCLDIASHPMENYTFVSHEPETPFIRKPFSPISSTKSSRDLSVANKTVEDPNRMQKMLLTKNEPLHQKLTDSAPCTPIKKRAHTDTGDEENDENMTSLSSRVIPTFTPSTTTMLCAMTPATIHKGVCPTGVNSYLEAGKDIEYSFEERRAGFVISDSEVKRALQV